MIIHTDQFPLIPRLRSATLSEKTDGTATLSLTYAEGAELPEYMDTLTIIHRGSVLWHGKVTSSTTANNAGALVHTVQAENFMWVLNHQTLGSQLLGTTTDTTRDILRIAQESYADLRALGSAFMANAPGWTCDAQGTPNPLAVLGLQTGSTANGGLGSGPFSNPLALSYYCILRKAQLNNPGTFYKPNYLTGQLQIMRGRDSLPETTLHTLQNSILSITATPNDAERPAAVAAVVQYKHVLSTTTGAARTRAKIIIHPEDTPLTTHGVRVYTAEAPSESQAEAQAQKIITQLREWYAAASQPQAAGSIVCKLRDIPESPLATRCTITGPGAVDTLASPVTAVDWDFLAQEVTLTLGAAIREPKINTIPFPEYNPANPTDPENPQPDPGPTPGPDPDDPEDPDPEDPDNPDPPTPGPGCNCKEYIFDPDWFTVTETATQVQVTVNQSKLTSVVDDMLSDISVDVQVDGLVETTEFGNLLATLNGNTAQGLDTNIHY